MKSRRAVLALAGTMAATGCLRLTGNAGQTTTSGGDEETTSSGVDEESPTSAPNTAQEQSASSTALSVDTFSPDNSFEDGQLFEENKFSVRSADGNIDISGEWNGDRDVISQAAANYKFELLSGESVLTSSDTKTIIRNYAYKAVQTADSLFITYHPSIGRDWEHSLSLMFNDNEYQIDPEVRPDRGVFECDLSGSTVEPGRYTWKLNITPADSAGQFGLSVPVGEFSEQLVAVKPDSDDFPSRSEAIADVGAVANESAVPVQRPEGGTEGGMRITESGVSGGSTSDDYPEGSMETSRSFGVDCDAGCAFGGKTNNRFRMVNVTTGASLTFTPD